MTGSAGDGAGNGLRRVPGRPSDGESTAERDPESALGDISAAKPHQ
ncbi:hypothetical protein [Streptomyces sp. NPDC050388]